MVSPVVKHPIRLVKSEGGSLHCLQASLMMLVRALTDVRLSWDEAERMSAYEPGRYTWPYATLKSLAELGLACRLIEVFDPRHMAVAAEEEIRRKLGGDVARQIIAGSELKLEQARAKACLADSRVTFETRVPRVEDIVRGLSEGWLVEIGLDYGVLHRTGRYEGHSIVAAATDGKCVQVFDPGPPGEGGQLIPLDTLAKAMYSPTREAASLMLVKSLDQLQH